MTSTVDDVMREIERSCSDQTVYRHKHFHIRDVTLLRDEIQRLRRHIQELRAVVSEAILWDAEDEDGVQAVWLEAAEQAMEETAT